MMCLLYLGVQERRRKWGSSVSRTPTSAHTAISSDILEVLIIVIENSMRLHLHC